MKMSPDQRAARAEFLKFIATGDDVLREKAYEMLTQVIQKRMEARKAKKNQEVKIEATVETVNESINQMLTSVAEVSEAPKKRGRKPLSEEEKQARLAAKEVLTPKKRGRKPKIQASAEETIPEAPKRSVGRPKKVQDVVEAAPKKRGPKPKVEVMAVETKKRGRKPLTDEQKEERRLAKESSDKEQTSVMKIAKSFSKLRQKLELNQSGMAAVLGVHQAEVSQFENGKKMPKEETIKKVQNMLKNMK